MPKLAVTSACVCRTKEILPLKILIAAVGKLKERYLIAGVAEYTKRLAPFADVTVKEIAEARLPHDPTAAQITAAIDDEGERLLKILPSSAYLIALDLHGTMLSSEALAAKIAAVTTYEKSAFAFVIGGAFGIAASVTQKADLRLKLSPMTFTHQMTRLLLVEQIYRAFKINAREKYHW